MEHGKLRKRFGAAAAALTVTVGLVGPAQARAEAQAAPSCAGWYHENYSDDVDFTKQGTYLKRGPYGHCETVTGVQSYRCSVKSGRRG
ncbi:hypothetical protein J2853_001878 [Streptosporangium lutulentum]|uniref:Secreted protein n=1 Tax=Streptosporangium lutulentum TaxID=1461250 RepID=A0ABT9Q7G6_9ACTN|nr:hypothetical protein [Streptosporangium lutulentum]